MTRRLLISLFMAMIFIMGVSMMLTISATSKILGGRQELILREVVDVVADGYISGGEEFVERLSTNNYRITIISPTGKILTESPDDFWYLVTDHNALEHFLRDVIEDEDVVSMHTSYLFGDLILAGIGLPDSTVIVASATMRTFADTMEEMKLQIVLVIFLSLILSAILARALSIYIVKPLNNLDLEDPDPNNEYKEISPLLLKIKEQKLDLAIQQEELKQGQTEFKAVSESLSEGLFLIEADDQLSFMNKSAKKILKIKGDVRGKLYSEILPANVSETIRDTDINKNGKCILSSKGRTYKVETTALALNEVKAGTSVLIYDITSQLNAENRRREFTANVSHELKTPLHIISGSAELLLSGIVKEEDKTKFVSQIYSESQRMKGLVEDLLKLGQLEEENKEISKSIINIYELAASVKENIAHFAEENDINVTLSGTPANIYCNGSMIYGALYNLVDNAIKYSPKGSSVHIRTESENGKAYIKVEDNGIGIPEEYQDRVFERFFRVDKSRSKEVGGSGLGLAIVKHSCMSNGGEISVESEVGKGSVFTITFPIANDTDIA